MDQCERLGLLLRSSEGGEARVYFNPDGAARSDRKQKTGGNHFLELSWICQERGLDRDALLQSHVADETVGDRGALLRSLRRLPGRLDYLLLHLVPRKAFPDLDDTRGLQIDDDSYRLAIFGFAVQPPVDGIGVEYVYPRCLLAMLLCEGLHRFVLEQKELLHVIEEG